MLSEADHSFIARHPVARLATADALGEPHVIPVCYVILGSNLYVAIDGKPKSGDPRNLKRLRNIAANPRVAVIIDHYDDDDWDRLGWLMLRGTAEIIDRGEEHGVAQNALRQRYVPYRSMALEALPVIALRIERVVRWGNVG